MRSTIVWVTLGLAVAGCAPARYLAKVNGEELTGAAIRKEWGQRHRGFEKYLATESEVRAVLQSTIDRRLFLQEARRIGLQEAPEIRAQVEGLRSRHMLAALVKQAIEEPARPSAQEVAAGYEKLREKYLMREVATATRQQAEEVRVRALAGEDFEELVMEKSVARSRGNRGTLEFRWGGSDLVREEASLPLREGDISQVIQTPEGWTVLKMEVRKANEPPPLEKIKERIESVLQRRRAQVLDREFLSSLRTKFAVTMAGCELSRAVLEKARADKDQRTCATWQGGSYTLEGLANRIDLEKVPAEQQAETLRTKVDDLVAEKLLEAEARARGLDRTPDVEAEVELLESELLVERFLTQYVTEEVTITHAEVASYIEAHRAELVVPESRLLAQIVIDDEREMKRAQDRLATGEPFEKVAADTTKVKEQALQGGRVGWLQRGDVPEALGAIFTAARGDVVGPFKQSDGLHLVKVQDIRPQAALERADAEAKVRTDLRSAKMVERYQKFLAELRSHAEIVISEAGIRKYLRDYPVPTGVKKAPEVKPGMGGAGQHGAEGKDGLGLELPAAAKPADPSPARH